jgi:nucleoside-diphosphate-sugar epimerase
MKETKTRALVTGASGFLGSYLVDLLLQHGYSVRGLVRRPDAELSERGVEIVQGDVRDPSAVAAACAGMDVAFHTAGISGIWGPWSSFHGVNTVGTRNVVEGCRRHGVSRLVYTSSPSVTFSGEHQINVDESAPFAKKWLCHYPHSKALAEQCVLEANDAPRLMTCALRPHLIWGPRDRHLIPRILARARAKQLRRVGEGTNQVDQIYVENAAWAHLQAAEALRPDSPVCGRAYFLSQDEPVNCWQWINEILALAGLPPVRRSISFPLAWRIGRGLEVYHELFNLSSEPRMTRFLAAQLAKSHYFDISRAKRDFGYQVRVSTSEGMERLGRSL